MEVNFTFWKFSLKIRINFCPRHPQFLDIFLCLLCSSPFPFSVILHMDNRLLLWKVMAPGQLVHFNTIVANVINRAFTDSPMMFNSLDIDSLFWSPLLRLQTFSIRFKFLFLVPLSILDTFFIFSVKTHVLLQRLRIYCQSLVFLLFSLQILALILWSLVATHNLWIETDISCGSW